MTTRIPVAFPLLLAVALASCSRDEQAPAAPTEPAGADQSAADADANARSLSDPLPNGMKLSFPYHLRRDGIEEVDPGVFQRRVRIEYIGLDQQEAIEAITADHVAAGYKTGKVTELDNGRVRMNFRHENEDRTTVTVLEGVSVTHASATGMIYIHIPVEAPANIPAESGEPGDSGNVIEE